MFESLVESIALYGAEIWGWQYKDRLDRIKRKYVKWILELNRGTPNTKLYSLRRNDDTGNKNESDKSNKV